MYIFILAPIKRGRDIEIKLSRSTIMSQVGFLQNISPNPQ